MSDWSVRKESRPMIGAAMVVVRRRERKRKMVAMAVVDDMVVMLMRRRSSAERVEDSMGPNHLGVKMGFWVGE